MGKRSDDDGQHDPEVPDSGLWAYVIRTVRPLRREDPLPPPGPTPQAPLPGKKRGRGDGSPSAAPSRTLPPAPPAGLDRRTEERLRRGQMEIEARLDLHGLTLAQARPALERFLLSGQARGLRCVLVITGKGGRPSRDPDNPLPEPGILRGAVPGWLAEPPLSHVVLRHFPAKGRHGGAGAVYILLRRPR